MLNYSSLSIHLSQPTAEEKDNAVDGKCVSPPSHPLILSTSVNADGSGKVSSSSVSNCEGKPYHNCPILLLLTCCSSSSLGKTVLFNIKEAHNHSFSSKVCSVFLFALTTLTHLYRPQTGDGMMLIKYRLFRPHKFFTGPSLLGEIMSIITLLQSRNPMPF